MLRIVYVFLSLIGPFFCVESKFFFSWQRLHLAEPVTSLCYCVLSFLPPQRRGAECTGHSAFDIVHCVPMRRVTLSCSWDPGPGLFCVAGQNFEVFRGKALGFGLMEALEGWCV